VKQEPWPARAKNPRPSGRGEVNAESLYRKVAGDIKAAIAAGAYPPGALLPSEAELAERYSVSRGTVRQAFAALRADGVIASRAPGAVVR
jgi:GntR family transcriptional regulator